MTYEEFKQLAEHPQHRDIPAIFKLEVIEIEELPKNKRSHYPKYKVYPHASALAPTLKEAEALMRKDIGYRQKMKEEDDYPMDTFCYYISECPMGLMHYEREYLSQRMYDGEGKLIDQTYCSSGFSLYYPTICDEPEYEKHPDEIFHGRPEEKIRFHRGDIVEVYCGDEVKLATVLGSPLTTKWVWDSIPRFQKRGMGIDDMPFDETDDTYTVIDGPGYEYHEHVSAMQVFAPHYHVPLYLQRRFKGYLEKAEKKQKEQEEKDRIYKQAHDCSIRNKEQLEKSEKCGCFNCGKIFPPSEITNYVSDGEPTALCPYCHIDSVIGDASGFPITPKFLRDMNKRWF